MKIISWEKDTYKKLFGRESQHDLMVAQVVYDGVVNKEKCMLIVQG